MGDFVTEIRKIPPITRFVCASCLAVTLSTMMGLVSGYQFIYTFSLAFKKLQIWRLYTSFFFGSGGITFIFEFVLLYRTMNDLESGPYLRRSADFGWQLFLAGVAILITSIPVSSMIFFRPFLLCLAYISSALAPVGTMTSVMGLVQLPVKYFPYVMLGFDLLLGGPGAVATSLPGAVVGHLWWWSVWGPELGGAGGVLLQWSGAPRWFRDYMGEGNTPPPGARNPDGTTGANVGGGVRVVPPRRFAEEAVAAGAERPAGYNWGTGGQKLGGG